MCVHTMKNFLLPLNYTDGRAYVRATAGGKRDHEMNFTAVQRNPFLKEVGTRIDEKSTGILRLEKNCGFTLLCT